MHKSKHHVEEIEPTTNDAQYEEDDNIFGEPKGKSKGKDFNKNRPTRIG